ncbi:uncharacterized protein LY79DRAFT_672651 [Colletotrichum navitas]|uniref:Uncharacterized protein n=1 Tax=Colletotrichum navitas TaxID=681940 RepID=A0AAD8PRE1_9PEZI|nr:uncharacterized protein LY79DRAFT_672651 [Colletotrichum navitas]KAK1579250.1 hypothetical protein LY79DRAFT_672651 [Colletotrichum navitas]
MAGFLDAFVRTTRWSLAHFSTDARAFLLIAFLAFLVLVVAACVCWAVIKCVGRRAKNRDEEANEPEGDDDDDDGDAAGERERNDDQSWANEPSWSCNTSEPRIPCRSQSRA